MCCCHGYHSGTAAITDARQTKLTANNNKYEVNSKFYFYSPFHFYLPFHLLLSQPPLSQRHGGRHRGTANKIDSE
jgi:hypothetical protein